MMRFEPVLLENTPDILIVVGDVNSTLACSLTAVKLGVPVAHVEAGLRSFDRSMPEEINRLVTDSLSQWLFVSERSGIDNLRHEGVPDERVHFVGNVMIDTLVHCRSRFEDSTVLDTLHLDDRDYAVLTLHRPSNVDDVSKFSDLMTALDRLQRELTIVFPVHPRTRTALNGIMPERLTNVRVVDPLGYCDFMKLVSRARLVLTDSGGIQEETTFLKVPCLTLRNNTERPVTITEGTNTLTGPDPSRIVDAALSTLSQPLKDPQIPELWDGRAAGRIVDVLFETG